MGDFNKDNTEAFLESVYRNKCHKSIQPLVKSLHYVIYMRVLYLHILVCFYDNLPMGNTTPHKTSAQLAIEEVEHYCENIKKIYDIAVNVCPFLPAAEKSLTRDIGNVSFSNKLVNIHWYFKSFIKYCLVYIPNIIENSTNYLGEYTIEQLEGKQDLTESKKFKVYGKSIINSEPRFVKIVDTTTGLNKTCLMGNNLTNEGPELYQSQKADLVIYQSSGTRQGTKVEYLIRIDKILYHVNIDSYGTHDRFCVHQRFDQKNKKWENQYNSSLNDRYKITRDVFLPKDSTKSQYCESHNEDHVDSNPFTKEKPKECLLLRY